MEHLKEIVRLNILDCQPEDEGDYTVTAVNSFGVASCNAEVLVHLEAPKFTVPLKDYPVKIKDTAHLVCQVKGLPRPEVTWLVNDKPLPLGPKFYTAYEDDRATLDIVDITPEDLQAVYSCQAKNIAGESSTAASLIAQGLCIVAEDTFTCLSVSVCMVLFLTQFCLSTLASVLKVNMRACIQI